MLFVLSLLKNVWSIFSLSSLVTLKRHGKCYIGFINFIKVSPRRCNVFLRKCWNSLKKYWTYVVFCCFKRLVHFFSLITGYFATPRKMLYRLIKVYFIKVSTGHYSVFLRNCKKSLKNIGPTLLFVVLRQANNVLSHSLWLENKYCFQGMNYQDLNHACSGFLTVIPTVNKNRLKCFTHLCNFFSFLPN